MHFARVTGTVVATEKVPAWKGSRLLLLEACDSSGKATGARPIVAVDLVSAAPGQLVFYVRGREAAVALANPENPADAAITGIVDAVREAPGEMRLMFLARVVGEVVATVKHPHLAALKLLMVRPEQTPGRPQPASVIAVDCVDSGIGDRVLVADEGNTAAQVLRLPRGPVRTVIVGVVDETDVPS